MTTQVLIADDHPLFRAALVQTLSDCMDDVSVLQARDLNEAFEHLNANDNIDLVLLDLHMPSNQGVSSGLNGGLTGLAHIRGQFPAVAVVVVSANEDPMVIRRALDYGAAGFIPKSADLSELSEALEAVFDCREWIPARLKRAVEEAVDANPIDDMAERIKTLTPQQLRVLEMVAQGQLNKQIADALGVQLRTVKAHMSEIFHKLNVRNRTQAGIAFRALDIKPQDRFDAHP
ncbi:MAG TPA: response regulator transcription factor [Wenzhouxiangella sp.]